MKNDWGKVKRKYEQIKVIEVVRELIQKFIRSWLKTILKFPNETKVYNRYSK